MNSIHRMESIGIETKPTRLTPSVSNAVESKNENSYPRNFNLKKLNEMEMKKLEEELKKLNESIKATEKMIRFKYNDEAEQIFVEVINTETQEVVTSLPPEFLIDLSIKMKELIGMFIDKKL
ncbi:flagellar protein FlaG [Paenibacillus sp. MSJ-34]|uniref:flagellar protein FlaG n=1 Tax=Paenibacillus sp. MSJ-34 TaxID=2841529 RepID=UPI001C117971|nr:flagellar protein FlaG [Paenibacillus sp. MSJ-34]MBU5440986.1 flagellar protein FlaG [Paenibacillus sp. MSJ-34]